MANFEVFEKKMVKICTKKSSSEDKSLQSVFLSMVDVE
jgi:hypothetical protein